jgi:hypothetical protein
MGFEFDPPIKVRLVLDSENSGWILEKFSKRLAEHLGSWNIEADIAGNPSEKADINHWLLYLHFQEKQLLSPHNTVLITHVDRPAKLKIISDNISKADIGICLSQMTQDFLIDHGISSQKLCYITPGHDGLIKPRKIKIGITSRVYNDGRKREGLLLDLAKSLDLSDFEFDIFGEGWDNIIEHLKISGAAVQYFPGSNDYQGDYRLICEQIPNFDYYLYTGMDEGSMGLLDALSAGIPTIVTPQGFHLDIKDGITYSFETLPQLVNVFQDIVKERNQRLNSVKNLTWKEYAKLHAIVWRMIVLGETEDIPTILHKGKTDFNPRRSFVNRIAKDFRFYSLPLFRRVAKTIKGKS